MSARQYTTFVPLHAESARELRYAIVGTGMMGREHIGNLKNLDGSSIVALVDPHPESLRLAELSTGANVPSFRTWDQAQAEAAVDVVVVASPNNTHLEVALAAIQAEKHVL
ncbi:MAG: hypothetical protein RL218_273, partial [Actinomycetota bacterium]